MTEHTELVERRRVYLAAEDWGNKVCQHYSCKGGGDLGYGEGYFVYYNNGAVHRVHENGYTIVQAPMSIEEVIDAYTRKDN